MEKLIEIDFLDIFQKVIILIICIQFFTFS